MDGSLARESPLTLNKLSVSESARDRVARLLDPVIFFSLLALIPLTAVPYGTVEPWWEALFECAVFTLGLLCLIEGLLGGRWCVMGGRLLLPPLALIVFALLQTLPFGGTAAVENPREVWRAVSADPYQTRLFACKLFALALAGGLLMRYTSSRRRLHVLICVIIGVAAASALFGILRQTAQGDEPSFILTYLQPGTGYGQFINRNHFAFLMEMALGLMLGLIAGGGVQRKRLLVYLAAVLPVWMALMLSNSRGGVLSMLSQMIFLALLLSVMPRPRKSAEYDGDRAFGSLRRLGGSVVVRAVLIVCLVGAMTAAVVLVGGDPLASRLETAPRELSARTGRLGIWEATWQLTKANRIIGVGFAGYRTAITEYYDYSGDQTLQQAHNDYLELLASGGLIGGALGAWFLIVLIRRAREQLRSTNTFHRAACLGALTGLFGVAVHSLVDFGLHITVNALVFTSLVVILASDESAEKRVLRDGEAHQHP